MDLALISAMPAISFALLTIDRVFITIPPRFQPCITDGISWVKAGQIDINLSARQANLRPSRPAQKENRLVFVSRMFPHQLN
jgi:hypothetical protein